MSDIYDELTKEYFNYQRSKKALIKEREKINAKLDEIEDILIALDGILCKSGNHIYEHFEKLKREEVAE